MTAIAVVSAKGGASKTTLALCLAGAAPGTVTVLDTDPSESAARWADALSMPGPTARSGSALRRQARLVDTEHLIIDTPPLYEDETVVRTACDLADIVLVPLNPSPADIDRLALVTPLLVDARWAVVITQERSYTRLGSRLRDDLADAGIPTLPIGMPSREATRTAWGETGPDPLGGQMLWQCLDTL